MTCLPTDPMAILAADEEGVLLWKVLPILLVTRIVEAIVTDPESRNIIAATVRAAREQTEALSVRVVR